MKKRDQKWKATRKNISNLKKCSWMILQLWQHDVKCVEAASVFPAETPGWASSPAWLWQPRSTLLLLWFCVVTAPMFQASTRGLGLPVGRGRRRSDPLHWWLLWVGFSTLWHTSLHTLFYVRLTRDVLQFPSACSFYSHFYSASKSPSSI